MIMYYDMIFYITNHSIATVTQQAMLYHPYSTAVDDGISLEPMVSRDDASAVC